MKLLLPKANSSLVDRFDCLLIKIDKIIYRKHYHQFMMQGKDNNQNLIKYSTNKFYKRLISECWKIK